MIITDQKYAPQIREWVSSILGQKVGGEQFAAIAFMHDGNIVGGAVFHNYMEHMIEVSIASTDPRWCSKEAIKTLFSYAFNKCGCGRINVTCNKKNKHVRNFVQRLGFKQEGCAREAFDGKNDAVIYGILKNECKWIN